MSGNLTNLIENFLQNPSKDNEISLISKLKNSEFLAPVLLNQALANPDGSAVYEEEGSNIKFILLEDEETNLSYFPAFSTKEEMMKWRNDSEQEVLNLRLKDYFAILKDAQDKYAGIVIDAYSHSFILNLQTLEKICQD